MYIKVNMYTKSAVMYCNGLKPTAIRYNGLV